VSVCVNQWQPISPAIRACCAADAFPFDGGKAEDDNDDDDDDSDDDDDDGDDFDVAADDADVEGDATSMNRTDDGSPAWRNVNDSSLTACLPLLARKAKKCVAASTEKCAAAAPLMAASVVDGVVFTLWGTFANVTVIDVMVLIVVYVVALTGLHLSLGLSCVDRL
jgi:hypothetical protein